MKMNKRMKRIVAVGVSVTTALWLSGAAMLVPVASVSALTADEIAAQIADLQAQLATLQAQLAELEETEAVTYEGVPAGFEFTKFLKKGSKGDEVKYMQIVLRAEVGESVVGTADGIFGSKTQAAVKQFQTAQGVTSDGIVGPVTRGKLNALLAAAPAAEEEEEEEAAAEEAAAAEEEEEEVVVVAAGALSVKLAAINPAAAMVSDGDGEPYIIARLTAGDKAVTVSSITVERLGSAGEAADFDKIWAVVNGQRRTSERSFGSDNLVTLSFTVGENNVVVPANGSVDITVAARGAGVGDAGHANALKIASISSTAGTVTGLPVTGSTMTVAGIAASDITYTYRGSSGTVDIGDKEVQVAQIRIQNDESSQDVYVKSITFRNYDATSGHTTAGPTDVSNFKLYLGSELLSTVATMDSDNYIHFDLSASPVTIKKGGSNYKDFTVKADINGGPSEYVELVISKTSDILAEDDNGGKTDNTASGTAKEYNIQGGTLTISEASDNPVNRNVIDNQNDIVLLKANLIAAEEQVEISALKVNLIGSITSTDLENIKAYVVKADGSQEEFGENATVNKHATDSTHADAENSFDNTVLIEGTNTLYVVVDLKSGSGGTVTANIAAADITATRTSDDQSITPTGSATGGTVTVVTAATLTVAAADSPGAATKVKGQKDVLFGAFTLTATADTEVTVTSVKLRLVGTGGTADQQDVTSIELLSADEATVYSGPEAMNASEDVSFTSLSAMPKVTSAGLKVIVRGDINSTINDTNITALNFRFVDSTYVEGSDGIGDATIGGLGSAVNLATITLASTGTLDVEILTGEVLSSQVLAKSSGVDIGKVRFTATNETVKIDKIVLTVDSTNDEEVEKLYLYNGTNLLASATAIGTTTTFDSLGLLVPAGTSKAVTLTVKGDLQSIATEYSTTSGTEILVHLDVDSSDLKAWSSGNPTTRVYGAVKATTGSNGVALASDATAAINDADGITATDTTVTYDTGSGTFNVGNLIKIDSEYMLITASTSTTFTVRRAVAGSTAATHADNAVITEYTQDVALNAHAYYGAGLTVTSDTMTSKNLAVWSSYTDVMKLTFTPDAASENTVVLNSVKISLQTADGIGSDASADWYITAIRLRQGSRTIGTASTTDMSSSSDTVTFSTLNEEISSGGETITVQVQIAGHVSTVTTTVDALQLSVASLGSYGYDGSTAVNTVGAWDLTAGDIDWDDSSSTQIQWIDQDEDVLLSPKWQSYSG